MESLSARHFPRVVFRSGSKNLWNPITRKALANLPEERVRLQVIDYLLEEAGVSRGRISTEYALSRHGIKGETGRQRTDILVFQDQKKEGASLLPETLIECKARNVSLSESSALQIAKYSQALEVPQLWLTNGHTDFWFQKVAAAEVTMRRNDSPLYPSKIPVTTLRQTPGYWIDRGFIASQSASGVQNWLDQVLQLFWDEVEEWKSTYLDLSRNPWQSGLSHYYRVVHLDEESDLAIGFVASDEQTSWLVALMNKHQSNVGMIVTNLDDLAAGRPDNTVVYTVNEKRIANLTDHIPLLPFKKQAMIVLNLPGFYESWFRQLLML